MRRHPSPVLIFVACALLTALASGCEPKLIPGTKIKDTPETKALVELVVNKYRKAMEAKDADTLVAMASPRFYETGGTPSAADDYNLDGLKKKLAEKFKLTITIQLDIALTDVIVDKEKNEGKVRYHYFLKYLVKYPSEERWETQSEDAEMGFVLENGEWKAIRGL
jgi:hypothetical protein